ncbi:MAG: HEAT repeat domain-containing protein [Candidatus Eremiobacterota bacterium]
MGIVDKGKMSDQKEDFPVTGEEEEFNTEIALLRVDTLIKEQNFLEAIEALFELDKKKYVKEEIDLMRQRIADRGDFLEYGIKGHHFYKNRDYENSLEYFEKYLKENPKDKKAWELRAEIEEKLNKLEEAIRSYENLEKLTEDLRIYRKKASCFYRLGNVKESINCLDYIIKKDPGNKDAIEFKKSCLTQYRTKGIREVPKNTKNNEKSQIWWEKNKKNIEISILAVFIILFITYYLGKDILIFNGLNSKDMGIKIKSILSLRGNNKDDAINALLEQLKDKDPLVRSTAVCVIGESGKESVSAGLIPLLKDPDWSVRGNTLDALKKIKAPASLESVIELVKNQNEYTDIRLKGLETMETIDNSKLSPLLPELLQDKEKKIRIFAATCIGRLSLKNHLSKLEARLAVETNHDVSSALALAINRLKKKNKEEKI